MDGLDVSAALLTVARDEEARLPLGVRYQLGDSSSPEVLAGHRCDGLTISFGLSDIEGFAGLAHNVHGWLVEGGFLVASLCCRRRRVSAEWPRNRTYFHEGFFQASGEASTLRQQVGAHHRHAVHLS